MSAPRLLTGPDDPRHGTERGYALGCRSLPCRAAHAARVAAGRARVQPLAEDDPRHGTPGGYSNRSCRCPDCSAAMARYLRTWRQRRREVVAS